MKHILMLMLVLAAGLSARDQNVQKLDKEYGFRDAVFEKNISAFTNMALTEDSQDLKVYARATDNLHTAAYTLQNIYYSFYKNRLTSVVFIADGAENSKALLAALTARYGRGESSKPYRHKVGWYGSRVNMIYDANPATNNATVYLFSKPMLYLERKDNKAAARASLAEANK